jgi:dynein heavy chain
MPSPPPYPPGKHLVLFVDDLNLPEKELSGAQPPLELLRQLQDAHGFYDRKKRTWKEVEGLTMVAACGPPGGGRQDMTGRLTRHFTMLSMPCPSEEGMRAVFGAILGGFLGAHFPPDLKIRMLKPMVQVKVIPLAPPLDPPLTLP